MRLPFATITAKGREPFDINLAHITRISPVTLDGESQYKISMTSGAFYVNQAQRDAIKAAVIRFNEEEVSQNFWKI